MVVALIALGVALGGTSVAATGLITGAQIKDHSIGLNDLAPAAVAKLHGARGPSGPQGASGATGAQGPAGTFLTGKLSFQSSGAQPVNAGAVGVAQALCPAGSVVIAGGGATNGQSLWGSFPSTSASLTGWSAGATAYSTLSSTVTAYAVCASQ